jgi:hypothetical protein
LDWLHFALLGLAGEWFRLFACVLCSFGLFVRLPGVVVVAHLLVCLIDGIS